MTNLRPYISILVLITVFYSGVSCFSQDIQFSQFYAVPLYQNPAFTGSMLMHRISFHQRLQWMRLDAKYSSSYASWDNHFEKLRGGLGVSASHDIQGSDKLISDDVAVFYATEVPLSKMFSLKGGVQLSYGWRTVDYSRFQYAQDFTDHGYQGNTYTQYGTTRFGFADISSGLVLYSEQIWVGFSAHHMNEPRQTFYSNTSNRLPAKLALTGGYKWVIKKMNIRSSFYERATEYNLTPTFHYKLQGKSDQLDLGLYTQLDRIILGFWYRGIPIKRYENIQNNESSVILLGTKYRNVVITYSYDITVSRLSRAQTGGSHELNITIHFEKKKKTKKPMKRLPCPDFFD